MDPQLCDELLCDASRRWFKPFPKRQISNSSKLKEFADDNFKFHRIGRKFSDRVKNTMGKGEIARYEHFLFYPQCFQKTCTANTLRPGLVWEKVNAFRQSMT